MAQILDLLLLSRLWYELLLLNLISAGVWNFEPWSTRGMVSEKHPYWSVVTLEPDGGLDPLLQGRRAAVLDKYEGQKKVRGTQDHLPRVALESPWLSSELLSLCLCEKKLFHPQNINILGWYRCWTAVWWEEPCALLFSFGIWQIFANVCRRLTHAPW